MTITRINSNERLSGAVTFKDLVFLGVVLHYQHRIRASLSTQAA